MKKEKRNRKKLGETVEKPYLYEKITSENCSGESSAYWNWVHSHADKNNDGELIELPQANPDVIGAYDNYENERSYYTDILYEGYKALSLREKQVFNLLRLNLEEEEIAKRLNVERTTIKNYRERITNKFFRVVDMEA